MTERKDMNPLYYGRFNNHGEVLEEFCRAGNEKRAFSILTARIAVRLGKTVVSVRQQYDGKKDNFKIKEVKDEKRPADSISNNQQAGKGTS